MGKWVGIVLAVLLGFQVLYVVSANIVLAYFLPGWVSTSNLKLSYSSASTWWPARVNIEDLSIRSHDYNIQFQLDIEDAAVSVALHRLPFREFSGDDVEAVGVRFKLRHNVKSLDASKRRIDAFPPIEGYPDPPVYRDPPPKPIPEAEDKRFTIHLTDIQAQVRELWIMEVRYQGEAQAKGGFKLRPGRALRLLPATLKLAGGSLTLGDIAIARTTNLDVTADIDAPDLEALPGKALFSKVTASMDGRLEGGDLSFLDTYLPIERSAALSGDWRTQAQLELRSGVLQPKSQVSITAPQANLRMQRPASDVTAELEAQLTVPPNEPSTIRLSSHVRGLSSGDAGPNVDLMHAVALIPETDISAELEPGLRTLTIEGLRAPQLKWFEQLVKESGTKLAGSAKFDMEWNDPNPTEASGKAKLELQQATVTNKDNSFAGNLSLDVDLARDGDKTFTFHPFKVEMTKAKLGIGDSQSDSFAGRIVSNSVQWMHGRKPAALQGTFDVYMRPAKALLPVLMADAPATVSKVLLTLDELHARLALFRSSDLTRVELLQAGTESITAKGAWEDKNEKSSGAFLLNTWLVDLGVSLKDGETSLDVGADKAFLKQAP